MNVLSVALVELFASADPSGWAMAAQARLNSNALPSAWQTCRVVMSILSVDGWEIDET
jgi:hypothetical protein